MTAREHTWDKVSAAVERLFSQGHTITVKAVAKTARVARATIYNDPDLLQFIQGYEGEQQFNEGFDAGSASADTNPKNASSSATDDWARGILHIEPGEPITRDLLRRRRARFHTSFTRIRAGTQPCNRRSTRPSKSSKTRPPEPGYQRIIRSVQLPQPRSPSRTKMRTDRCFFLIGEKRQTILAHFLLDRRPPRLWPSSIHSF